MDEYMLTTVDNPFDPFTRFDEWLSYDLSQGHDTLGLLARVAVSSHEVSDVDNELAIARAIDEIVAENVFGIHKKVKRGDL